MASNNRQLEFPRRIGQRSTRRWLLYVCLPACALISIGIPSQILAHSSLRFDGDWSVIIETHDGACPPAIRYPVAIRDNVVANAGDASAAVSGRVTSTGIVRVTVRSGGSWASGSGHLTKTSGTGVWRGQGTSGFCIGTWQAERRSNGARVMNEGARIYNYAPDAARSYHPGYQTR